MLLDFGANSVKDESAAIIAATLGGVIKIASVSAGIPLAAEGSRLQVADQLYFKRVRFLSYARPAAARELNFGKPFCNSQNFHYE